MTPGARIAAAIELLAEVDAHDRPADQVVQDYVRQRRFMGAKDRRAVTDMVFAAIRARARTAWWLALAAGNDPEQAGAIAAESPADPRARVFAERVLNAGWTAAQLAEVCDGTGYNPPPPEGNEPALLQALEGQQLDDPRQPDWVRLETPAWLMPAFRDAFGEATETELTALRQEAPVDLRVNRLLADGPREVSEALAAEQIETTTTPLSPLGLRLTGRRAVQATAPYRDGLVELQDEGSQLIALLVAAKPGMAVCDFCAGAGGKTLALAAEMEDRGRLVALDIDGERLGRAGPRLQRAGARNVERRLLATSQDGDGDPFVEEHAGSFDRVLIDAPCTGVGAWRRQPDSRWRLSEHALAQRTNDQDRILAQAAKLVKPGGRLIYATCSLLPQENRERTWDFQSAHPAFRPVPAEQVWREGIGSPAGGTPPVDGHDLTLTPARHGTDGFYVAVFERTTDTGGSTIGGARK
ncbi:MAG: RsmB/NOP family class I SAM-dependent RNA methyltransferase [Rhodovibrio sp.]|nr:RsmB/NOP family class I SAM-dependent RNA methyltransferase [Rhodovibrio sp.]